LTRFSSKLSQETFILSRQISKLSQAIFKLSQQTFKLSQETFLCQDLNFSSYPLLNGSCLLHSHSSGLRNESSTLNTLKITTTKSTKTGKRKSILHVFLRVLPWCPDDTGRSGWGYSSPDIANLNNIIGEEQELGRYIFGDSRKSIEYMEL
jgi:hypothetical protein